MREALEGKIREKGNFPCRCRGIVEPGVPLQLQLSLFVFRGVQEGLRIVDRVEIDLGVVAEFKGDLCVLKSVEGNGFHQDGEAVRGFGGVARIEKEGRGGGREEEGGRGRGRRRRGGRGSG